MRFRKLKMKRFLSANIRVRFFIAFYFIVIHSAVPADAMSVPTFNIRDQVENKKTGTSYDNSVEVPDSHKAAEVFDQLPTPSDERAGYYQGIIDKANDAAGYKATLNSSGIPLEYSLGGTSKEEEDGNNAYYVPLKKKSPGDFHRTKVEIAQDQENKVSLQKNVPGDGGGTGTQFGEENSDRPGAFLMDKSRDSFGATKYEMKLHPDDKILSKKILPDGESGADRSRSRKKNDVPWAFQLDKFRGVFHAIKGKKIKRHHNGGVIFKGGFLGNNRGTSAHDDSLLNVPHKYYFSSDKYRTRKDRENNIFKVFKKNSLSKDDGYGKHMKDDGNEVAQPPLKDISSSDEAVLRLPINKGYDNFDKSSSSGVGSRVANLVRDNLENRIGVPFKDIPSDEDVNNWTKGEKNFRAFPNYTPENNYTHISGEIGQEIVENKEDINTSHTDKWTDQGFFDRIENGDLSIGVTEPSNPISHDDSNEKKATGNNVANIFQEKSSEVKDTIQDTAVDEIAYPILKQHTLLMNKHNHVEKNLKLVKPTPKLELLKKIPNKKIHSSKRETLVSNKGLLGFLSYILSKDSRSSTKHIWIFIGILVLAVFISLLISIFCYMRCKSKKRTEIIVYQKLVPKFSIGDDDSDLESFENSDDAHLYMCEDDSTTNRNCFNTYFVKKTNQKTSDGKLYTALDNSLTKLVDPEDKQSSDTVIDIEEGSLKFMKNFLNVHLFLENTCTTGDSDLMDKEDSPTRIQNMVDSDNRIAFLEMSFEITENELVCNENWSQSIENIGEKLGTKNLEDNTFLEKTLSVKENEMVSDQNWPITITFANSDIKPILENSSAMMENEIVKEENWPPTMQDFDNFAFNAFVKHSSPNEENKRAVEELRHTSIQDTGISNINPCLEDSTTIKEERYEESCPICIQDLIGSDINPSLENSPANEEKEIIEENYRITNLPNCVDSDIIPSMETISRTELDVSEKNPSDVQSNHLLIESADSEDEDDWLWPSYLSSEDPIESKEGFLRMTRIPKRKTKQPHKSVENNVLNEYEEMKSKKTSLLRTIGLVHEVPLGVISYPSSDFDKESSGYLSDEDVYSDVLRCIQSPSARSIDSNPKTILENNGLFNK